MNLTDAWRMADGAGTPQVDRPEQDDANDPQGNRTDTRPDSHELWKLDEQKRRTTDQRC